jgi:hypothetical protein
VNTAPYVIAIVLIVTAVAFGVRRLVRAISHYRGTKIVTCPETGRPASVEVDALHALLTSTVGPADIRLENCCRWPLKEECGQECLVGLDVAPHECLVSSVLMHWYRNKSCCFCGQRFEEVHWIDHRPALRRPEGSLVRWSDVPFDNLSTVLETHMPVCWNCYIAQDFIREHPDLVIYRPGHFENHGAVDHSRVSRMN